MKAEERLSREDYPELEFSAWDCSWRIASSVADDACASAPSAFPYCHPSGSLEKQRNTCILSNETRGMERGGKRGGERREEVERGGEREKKLLNLVMCDVFNTFVIFEDIGILRCNTFGSIKVVKLVCEFFYIDRASNTSLHY